MADLPVGSRVICRSDNKIQGTVVSWDDIPEDHWWRGNRSNPGTVNRHYVKIELALWKVNWPIYHKPYYAWADDYSWIVVESEPDLIPSNPFHDDLSDRLEGLLD